MSSETGLQLSECARTRRASAKNCLFAKGIPALHAQQHSHLAGHPGERVPQAGGLSAAEEAMAFVLGEPHVDDEWKGIGSVRRGRNSKVRLRCNRDRAGTERPRHLGQVHWRKFAQSDGTAPPIQAPRSRRNTNYHRE